MSSYLDHTDTSRKSWKVKGLNVSLGMLNSQDPESPQGQTSGMFMRSFLIGLTGVERLRLDEVDAIPWAAVLDQMTRIKMSISIHHCFLPVDAM